jgi:hypothetical protein
MLSGAIFEKSTWIIGYFHDVTIEPATVEFEIEPIRKSDVTEASALGYDTNPAVVSDVMKTGDNIVGKVTNNSSEEKSLEVIILFRDDKGNVRGGESVYESVPGGKSKPFKCNTTYEDWITNNFERFAYIR